MNKPNEKPQFDLGELAATPGALAALENGGQSPIDFLCRHLRGDWGDRCDDDRKETNRAWSKASGLQPNADDRVWVINEIDRSVTTLVAAGRV